MFSKMFLVKAIAVAAVTFIGAQAASPLADVVLNIEAVREANVAAVDGHLFVCVNAFFVPPCNIFSFNVGQCINFVAPFDNSISSLGPDPGFSCIIYLDSNCSGPSLKVTNPGIPNLTPTGFNDQISSFRCFFN